MKQKTSYQKRKFKELFKQTLEENNSIIKFAKELPTKRTYNNGKLQDDIVYNIKILMYNVAHASSRKGRMEFLKYCDKRIDSYIDPWKGGYEDESAIEIYNEIVEKYNKLMKEK